MHDLIGILVLIATVLLFHNIAMKQKRTKAAEKLLTTPYNTYIIIYPLQPCITSVVNAN